MIGIDSLQVNDNLPRRGTTYLKNQRPLQAKSTTYAPHPTPNCRRSVKLADLRDNSDLSRIASPSDNDLRRLEKYRRAIALIERLQS